MGVNFTGCGSGHSVSFRKEEYRCDALSPLPVDQDDNGDSSLSEKQDDNNDIFVSATVIEDNTKSKERDSEENNEN